MWFKCKVCEEKSKRILDLKEQILHLRNTLNPPADITAYEANAILNGTQDVLEFPTKDETKELLDIEAEANAILTGNY